MKKIALFLIGLIAIAAINSSLMIMFFGDSMNQLIWKIVYTIESVAVGLIYAKITNPHLDF